MTTTNYPRRVKLADARIVNAQNIEAPEDAQINATLAVAEATLALAEQQRLANVIAYSDGPPDHGAWDDQIEEGLGLA